MTLQYFPWSFWIPRKRMLNVCVCTCRWLKFSYECGKEHGDNTMSCSFSNHTISLWTLTLCSKGTWYLIRALKSQDMWDCCICATPHRRIGSHIVFRFGRSLIYEKVQGHMDFHENGERAWDGIFCCSLENVDRNAWNWISCCLEFN